MAKSKTDKGYAVTYFNTRSKKWVSEHVATEKEAKEKRTDIADNSKGKIRATFSKIR